MEKIDFLRGLLEKYCARWQAEGGKFCTKYSVREFQGQKYCCALGTIQTYCHGNKTQHFTVFAFEDFLNQISCLRFTYRELDAFVAGFDGYVGPNYKDSQEFYELGVEFAKLYHPETLP